MGSAAQPGCWQRNWRIVLMRSWVAQFCVALLLIAGTCAFYIQFSLNKAKAQVTTNSPAPRFNAKFSGDDLVKFQSGDRQMGPGNRALVRFIVNMVAGPSRLNYNLTEPDREDYSELGQSTFVDRLLKQRKEGFYVEAGAHNGESFSNSLFFEKNRGWQGLLIEPNPYTYSDLLFKRRKCYSINACLSPNNRASIYTFKPAGLEGGLLKKMDAKQQASLQSHPDYRGKDLDIQCLPLSSIMIALGPSYIDYLALDIPGAEIEVIKSVPFRTLTIDVISISYRVYKPGSSTIDAAATAKKLQTLRDFFKTLDVYNEVGILPATKGKRSAQVDADGQDIFFARNDIE